MRPTLSVQVAVLGSTEVVIGARSVALRPRERSVVAALALCGPAGATTDDVAELVWGGDVPVSARKSVHNHVRRLRAEIGPGVVETKGNRYRLTESVEVDAHLVVAAVGDDRELTAWELARLSELVTRWRGEPYTDPANAPAVVAERHRLADVRGGLLVAIGETRLALGQPEAAAASLLAVLDSEPYDERAWWLLAIARYRAGQRRESLRVLDDARRRLAEVGMPPGKQLVDLERLIVADDPAVFRASLLSAPEAAPAFIGRETQQGVVLRLLGRDRPAVVITGDPGVGKTALARVVAASATASGWTVLWGDCDAEPTVPLSPVRQMIGELPMGGDRERLFDAVTAAVRARGDGRRVLLVVDDAHLAGPTTLRLLAHLRATVDGLAVVAVSRPAPADTVRGALATAEPVEVIPLSGFEAREIETWLDANVAERDPSWASWLHGQTAGNPLLLAELVRVLDLRRPPPADAEHQILPVAVQALLLDRLKNLTEVARHAVQVAAVLGMSFRSADLVALLGDHHGIDEAERAALLVGGAQVNVLRFPHALVQHAAYTSLSEGARVELHDTAGGVLLARGGPPGEVARHHLEAAELDPARAVESARAAADVAMAAYAFDEAAELLRRALEVSTTETDERVRCELEVEAGEALRRAGDPAQQSMLFRAAERAAQLGEGDLLARAALSICNIGVLTAAGATEQRIIDVVDRALATARTPALRAELAGAASWALGFTGQGRRCRSLYERAEAEARSLGDVDLLGKVLPYALLALGRPDDLDRKAAISDELLVMDDPIAVFQGYQLRFTRHLQLGDVRMDDDLRELHRLADVIREPQRHLYVAWYDAARLHLRGELEASEDVITRALDHGGAVPDSLAVAVYGAQVLAIRAAQGRLPELLDAVTGFVADQPGVLAWSAAQAWIGAVAGEALLAVDAFDRCAADDFAGFDDDLTWTGAMTILAIAAGVLGDAHRSAVVYRRLVPWSGRLSWVATCSFGPIDTGLAHAAAASGDDAAATRHRRMAGALAARLRVG